MFFGQGPAVLEPGQRDRRAVARGVRQSVGVRPGQPEELLDGRRRDPHTVRVRADGHIRGRAREHQVAAGVAPPPAVGRLRRVRARRGPRRVLRRVRGHGRVGAQDVAVAVVRRGHHAAQAARVAPHQAAQLHADGLRGPVCGQATAAARSHRPLLSRGRQDGRGPTRPRPDADAAAAPVAPATRHSAMTARTVRPPPPGRLFADSSLPLNPCFPDEKKRVETA